MISGVGLRVKSKIGTSQGPNVLSSKLLVWTTCLFHSFTLEQQKWGINNLNQTGVAVTIDITDQPRNNPRYPPIAPIKSLNKSYS